MMNWRIGLCWAVVTMTGIATAPSNAADEVPAKITDLREGMTAHEVSKRLNNQKPERIVRQILYRRHLEQWYYNNGSVRLEFDCRPATEPRLIAIHLPMGNEKP